MVRLTMTATMVAGIEAFAANDHETWILAQNEDEPPLSHPAIGNPISHDQVINISKWLRSFSKRRDEEERKKNLNSLPTGHLDELLRGSKIYKPPPKPKPEQVSSRITLLLAIFLHELAQTSEFNALMVRLRREEEEKAYERMINPPLPVETFGQRFPISAHPELFDTAKLSKEEEQDEVTFTDINRQMALIINILVSIVACSVAIWMVSGHWSTPKRLGLSMGGSGMVGVAEVVVYAGYLRRIREAKSKHRKAVEVKEIIKTWVIGGDEKATDEGVSEPVPTQKKDSNEARQRKGRKKG